LETRKGSVALERRATRKQRRALRSAGGPTGGKRHRKRDEGEGASSRESAAGLRGHSTPRVEASTGRVPPTCLPQASTLTHELQIRESSCASEH
jgi:hypothetical protein